MSINENVSYLNILILKNVNDKGVPKKDQNSISMVRAS